MPLTSITEIRKQEILKAFYQIAMSEGVENSSMAKIAKVLEVQPSLIVHYFKTKEDLVSALIDYCLERYFQIFEEEFSRPGTPSLKIKTLIERLFSKEWNDLFDDGVFYSSYSLVFRDDNIKSKFKILHEGLRKKLSLIIESYLEFNNEDISQADELSNQVFTLVDGSYYYINMLSSKKEQAFHLESAKKLAQTLLKIS
ncbi:TetR family transcriptional regulator [Algoriphagus hitonicola]|uniref:Biofilm operon icaADBC HTH-type negative transcriptional regulator IcaR n=1 Tax=Algoriphagus hitonicola TaxID=435880 RepID=A0A1I2XK92_9BACT|nr:TetR family transcriptional regulator [Algoriphagus hitonicola]SFH13439.1 transcriptional regulator, TetR family [Algoriphagus hitonicola]